jgi:tetratricopeptide (TPR) repeat protein
MAYDAGNISTDVTPPGEIEQQLTRARQFEQTGQIQEAAAVYHEILARHPENFFALHQLGLIAHQTGQHEMAEDLICRALEINPTIAEAWNNLGIILKNQGEVDDAMVAYRQAIALRPEYAAAINNLGNALRGRGQFKEALETHRQAIAAQPGDAPGYFHAGAALTALGQTDEALELCQKAIAIDPRSAEAHIALGNALKAKGEPAEAIAQYRRAIALRPDFAEGFFNLGNALQENGQLDDAMAAYRQAIGIKSNYAAAHSNLANVLKEVGQIEAAILYYRQAIAFDPSFAEAYHNLGIALKEAGRFTEAVAAFRQAIAIREDFAEAHLDLSLVLLLLGDYHEGWMEYEWRWRVASAASKLSNLRDKFTEPRWAGTDPRGKTLLIYHEQGVGDVIQFARLLPMLRERGANVIFDAPRSLRRLLNQSADLLKAAIVVRDDAGNLPATFKTPAGEAAPNAIGRTPVPNATVPHATGPNATVPNAPMLNSTVPTGTAPTGIASPASASVKTGIPLRFDLQLPLLSLPRVMNHAAPFGPVEIFPYLRADDGSRRQWRKRLEALPGHKIGLCWAGNPTHINDRNRSMPLAALAPIARENLSFISLQIGHGSSQARTPPAGMRLVDWTDSITDFAETAALVAELDLVICVDTAVAHLAGALNKPVWVLVPFVADFRWGISGDATAWYPSMKLFRQSEIGRWDDVLARVAEELDRTTKPSRP